MRPSARAAAPASWAGGPPPASPCARRAVGAMRFADLGAGRQRADHTGATGRDPAGEHPHRPHQRGLSGPVGLGHRAAPREPRTCGRRREDAECGAPLPRRRGRSAGPGPDPHPRHRPRTRAHRDPVGARHVCPRACSARRRPSPAAAPARARRAPPPPRRRGPRGARPPELPAAPRRGGHPAGPPAPAHAPREVGRGPVARVSDDLLGPDTGLSHGAGGPLDVGAQRLEDRRELARRARRVLAGHTGSPGRTRRTRWAEPVKDALPRHTTPPHLEPRSADVAPGPFATPAFSPDPHGAIRTADLRTGAVGRGLTGCAQARLSPRAPTRATVSP